ncbi:MAG: sensor histidine kinase [Candidatus Marinimicrobia bacterium]|nr:sensor histidine kinase [Candidatus Neomarinimicrobiota bacterium]
MRFTIKDYNFELRHLIVFFTILALFQIILSFLHSNSTTDLMSKALDVYRKDSAERIADLTTSSLELILEQSQVSPPSTTDDIQKTIERFDLILSQQTLQKNIDDIGIIIVQGNNEYYINTGAQLYALFYESTLPELSQVDSIAFYWFNTAREKLLKTEQIYSYLRGDDTFHVLVPFVPYGNFMGAIYMRISPDFSHLVREITKAYDMSSALFSVLILLGLVAIFYISSYTVQERNRAQQELFKSREEQLRQEIEHQKEAAFTRRIYHAHHKAEKVMGFITEDLRALNNTNLETIRMRITRYAKFVARVIYDMKSSNPPINIVRGSTFNTDVNKVISFIIENVFNRVYRPSSRTKINTHLDKDFPIVNVNENVIWTIIEPLIQNAIDHNQEDEVEITITTASDEAGAWIILVEDDGPGINAELLQKSESGITKIFLENETTKLRKENAGFGCFIAYENCKRCGWKLDVKNKDTGGAQYKIIV